MMKKEISPAMTAGLVVVVVLVLVFAVWRTFASQPAGDASKVPPGFPGGPPATAGAHGQFPPGVSPPLGAPGSPRNPPGAVTAH